MTHPLPVGARVLIGPLPATICRILPILHPTTFAIAAYGYEIMVGGGATRIVVASEITESSL